MPRKLINWTLFIILCLIWGSSFILMKTGLYGPQNTVLLSAWQVAALRLLSAGLVLIPVFFYQWKNIPFKHWGYMLLSGLLGNFFPAFLFCIAETKIDSALAGTLNVLTPIFVILSGIVIYKNKFPVNKIWGIIIGLAGSFLLFLTKKNDDSGQVLYAGLIVLATIFYGININMVQHQLKGVSSSIIASFAFTALSIPSAIILYATGYFSLPLGNEAFIKATAASCTLGVAGTAIASIIYYMLMKRGGPIFASLVTYGIPFVAMAWGVYYGEQVTISQVLCLLIILSGVYIVNLDFSKWKSRFQKKTADS